MNDVCAEGFGGAIVKMNRIEQMLYCQLGDAIGSVNTSPMFCNPEFADYARK
jgi:hypothetical protein